MKQSSRPITGFPVVTICLKSDSDYNFELGYDFDLSWDDKIIQIEDTNSSHIDVFEPRIIKSLNYWEEGRPVPTIAFQKKFAYLSKETCYQIDCLVLSPAQDVVLFPQYLLPILKIMYLLPMGRRYNILGPHN